MIAAILMSSVLRSGAEAGGKNYNVRNIVFVKSSGGPKEITILLKAWGAGDQGALNRLTPLVYDELRRMARRYMRRERAGNTLQTTALINEAYLRLVDAQSVDWQDRVHFFAVSAKVMRRILVDAARARGSAKRGGLVIRVDHSTAVDLDQIPEVGRSAELIALDDALNALAEIDPRKARVIELRFFGGLSVEETGGVLGISPQSVLRDWKLAKVWLIREMAKGGGRRSADRRE
jgi:RNA polymerase sigma factor (TIGR02999 family)